MTGEPSGGSIRPKAKSRPKALRPLEDDEEGVSASVHAEAPAPAIQDAPQAAFEESMKTVEV